MLHVFVLFASLSLPVTPNAPAIDSPNYWNPAWRDSAAEYRGHLEAYHQEFYSYDFALSFTMVPLAGDILGEGVYLGKTWTGIEFLAARTAAVATATVGAVRLIGGKSNTGLNIGLLVGGLLIDGLLKWWEISNVMHTVSHQNEDLVDKWRIETPDIVPGSIRYPRKTWPAWITAWPEPRHPQNARGAVDQPIPAIQSATGNE
ncbi:MAG TPA: hypothetical protein VG537_11195 [Candidatus Kapabacteria bacterium]|jgi:hypothetical protein|nr:hypothetical protein [Candidatus Kapabacteria bacterium]